MDEQYENLWEDHAGWWIDGFTDGADPEYEEQILPMAGAELAGARHVLDIGCGDGQISRLASAQGSTVVSIDPTWKLVCELLQSAEVAQRSLEQGRLHCRLPMSASMRSFACLVFEHINDVDDAIAEVSRVLELGGRFCFFSQSPDPANARFRLD